MGMDLNGAGGYVRFSNIAWSKIRKLAYDYGWKPQGTDSGLLKY